MSKASLFSIGIAVTFSCSSVALASEQTDPWSGLYGGLTYSSSKIDATGTKSGSASYSVDADNDNTNVGLFVGYNYNLSPVIIGLEVGLQDKLAEDPSPSELEGKVTTTRSENIKSRLATPWTKCFRMLFMVAVA